MKRLLMFVLLAAMFLAGCAEKKESGAPIRGARGTTGGGGGTTGPTPTTLAKGWGSIYQQSAGQNFSSMAQILGSAATWIGGIGYISGLPPQQKTQTGQDNTGAYFRGNIKLASGLVTNLNGMAQAAAGSEFYVDLFDTNVMTGVEQYPVEIPERVGQDNFPWWINKTGTTMTVTIESNYEKMTFQGNVNQNTFQGTMSFTIKCQYDETNMTCGAVQGNTGGILGNFSVAICDMFACQ